MRSRRFLFILVLNTVLFACQGNKQTDTKAGLAGTQAKQTVQSSYLVGYLPVYKELTDSFDLRQLDYLTHLNLAFANPDMNGQFQLDDHFLCMSGAHGHPINGEQLRSIISQAHHSGVKVLLSLGGGWIPNCAGDWHELLNDSNRQQLVANLITLVNDFALDGLDIDLEGVLLTEIDQAGNYTPFIRELSAQLKAQGKLLTVATASYQGGMIPESAIAYFDLIYLMSYDAIGPTWGVAGSEHATLQQAEQDLQLWLKKGAKKQQLVLGLPFYGYGFGTYRSDYAIKDLVADFGKNILQQDLLGHACPSCDYVTYNGIDSLKAKTQLAMEYGSGVMIWELTHDLPHPASLLQNIHHQMTLSDR